MERGALFRICAHTRREDYVTDRFHEASDANFSSNALMYLMIKCGLSNYLLRETLGIYRSSHSWECGCFGLRRWPLLEYSHLCWYHTLVAMGVQCLFLGLPQVTIMRNSPGADLAMSTGHCDVVLLTAPSSTFGFFMGYFSKGFRVYYRDIQTTTDAVKILKKG